MNMLQKWNRKYKERRQAGIDFREGLRTNARNFAQELIDTTTQVYPQGYTPSVEINTGKYFSFLSDSTVISLVETELKKLDSSQKLVHLGGSGDGSLIRLALFAPS